MTKEELIEKAKTRRIDFEGKVRVGCNWDGSRNRWYYAQYADQDGVHACPKGCEDEIDCYSPIPFDEIGYSLIEELTSDIID